MTEEVARSAGGVRFRQRNGARLFATILMAATVTFAAVNETCLSLQGYSGIINVPNAMISPEGQMTFLLSNQTSPNLLDSFPDSHFKNFILTIGVFPCIEITGRFINALPWGPRDLSADIKCGYSFSVFNPWLPSIACGIQDISGGAVFLSTKYLVLSEEIRKLRVSVGYGTGPSRMEGVFFGAELFLAPFLQLLYDNDGDQAGIALRLTTARNVVHYPFAMSFMIKNVYKDKTPMFTCAASVSCDLKNGDWPAPPVLPGRTHAADSTGVPEKAPSVFTPGDLVRQLTEYGLENISVATRDKAIIVYYENNRFGHNEVDALGIVLGAASAMDDSSYDTLQVTMLQSGVPVISVKAGTNNYRQFLRTGDAAGLCLKINNPDISIKRISFPERANGTTGKIRCEVSPRLRNFLGTEVGAFDYQLSLNADAFVSLWPGGSFAARMVLPIWNTVNFNENKAFSSSRENTHLNSASLFQFVNFGHGVTMLFSTGLHDKKYISVIDDMRFTSESGFFRIGVEGGYFIAGGRHRTTVLPYAGFQLPKDIFFKITGGVFWEQDTGIDISIIRRFYDIDLTFFMKYTKNVFDEFDKFVGAQISIPLTLRKGMRPRIVSISGKDDWRTSLATRVAEKGRLNYISTACGVIPGRLVSLDTDYFNRNRLDRRYILEHKHLLLDSWMHNH